MRRPLLIALLVLVKFPMGIAALTSTMEGIERRIRLLEEGDSAKDSKIAALDAISTSLKSGLRALEDENKALAGEVVGLRTENRDLRALLQPRKTKRSSDNTTTFAQHQHHRRNTLSSATVEGSGRVSIYALAGTETLVVDGDMIVNGKVFAEGGEVNELLTPTPTVSSVPTQEQTMEPTREPTPSPTSWTYGK